MVRKPKTPDGTRIYAIGDVHGRLDLLQELHQDITRDMAEKPKPRGVLVHLGDYVDRGPAPLPEFRGAMPARLGRPGPVLVPPGEPIEEDEGPGDRAERAAAEAPPPAEVPQMRRRAPAHPVPPPPGAPPTVAQPPPAEEPWWIPELR